MLPSPRPDLLKGSAHCYQLSAHLAACTQGFPQPTGHKPTVGQGGAGEGRKKEISEGVRGQGTEGRG